MMRKRIALVTGGTRGIGLAISTRLASMGYSLLINGVRPVEAVDGVLQSLRAFGGEVEYFPADIADAAARKAMVEYAVRVFGTIDVLINNAGIAPKERKDILEATEESFEQLIKTNLQGPYFLTQQVANVMIARQASGDRTPQCVVTISSISSTVVSVNRGEYCVAKSGLSMMTKLFAARLGEYAIPVYEIQPGVIQTDMTSGVKEKYDTLFANGLTVEKRWGQPEDIASAVGALVAGTIPYATGQVLILDGGLTINRL